MKEANQGAAAGTKVLISNCMQDAGLFLSATIRVMMINPKDVDPKAPKPAAVKPFKLVNPTQVEPEVEP